MKTNSFYTIVLFFITIFTAQSQWIQVGTDIYGETEGDKSGWSVSVNAEGNIVAIGLPFNDDNGEDSGQVRVYKNISGSWTQMGEDIVGDPNWGYSGWSVSLSDDGLTIAIGAPEAYIEDLFYAGQVKIYHFSSGSWQQVGDDITGETTTDDRAGNSVSLSADGSVIAIASYGIYNFKGRVRVFENVAGVWTQIGDSIDGEDLHEQFGYSISLSKNGSVLAVGTPSNVNNDYPEGRVRVYANNSGVWEQVGVTLISDEDNDYFGNSVSLNADGTKLAVGAPRNSESAYWTGKVKVFQNNSGNWELMGDAIYGESVGDYFGTSVSLNNSGDKLVIGAKRYLSSNGSTTVFQYSSGIWSQLGNTMVGDASNDYSGNSVSINSDGSLIVIGAPGNDLNGDNSGQVKIFEYSDTTSIDDFSSDSIQVYPNPFSKYISFKNIPTDIKKITITNSIGKIIKLVTVPKQNNFDLSILRSGIYLIKVHTKNKVFTTKIIKQ
jgi:hypothetical protein